MENFLPGSASLIDCIDKRLMVTLRDGRKLFGVLRSYDQFANLVLQHTVERIYLNGKFGETSRGIFVIRGENVVLLGEVDEQAERQCHAVLTQLPHEELIKLQKADAIERRRKDKIKQKILYEQKGFSVDGVDTDHY